MKRAIVFPLLDPPHACPVCSSPRLRPLLEYDVPQPVAIDASRLALVGCEECGIAWSHPLPTAEALISYYESDSGWGRHRAYTEEQTAGKLAKKRAARRKNFGRISALIGRPGSALDFDSGVGGFLDVLRDAGWLTAGIEVDPHAREIVARRHAVLDDVPRGPTFDLVIAYHVLEHLGDPASTMRAFAAATRPGGHFYASVRDAGSLAEHGKLRYVANARHVFTYTEEGLRSLLNLAGYELVEVWHDQHWLRVLARSADKPVPRRPAPLAALEESLRGYAAAFGARRPVARRSPRSRQRLLRRIACRLRVPALRSM